VSEYEFDVGRRALQGAAAGGALKLNTALANEYSDTVDSLISFNRNI